MSTNIRLVDESSVAEGKASPAGSTVPLSRTGEVLDLLRRNEARTTTDLAEVMGVARSTVTERLQPLMRAGLVVQAGATSSARGRPAGILAFNKKAGVTLAAQVGMSGTLVAVTDLAGEILWRSQTDLDVSEGPEALLRLLEREFAAGLSEAGQSQPRIFGVGVGLPGDLEIGSTTGSAAPELASWRTFPFASRLSQIFGCPAFIDRDVNFMALGEHRVTWPEAKILLCLKVGTVIACGLVIDGRVIRGASGLSGEIGHTKLHDSDKACVCGSRGCLNTEAGGASLAAQLSAKGFNARTARDVAALTNSGVVEAGQVVRRAGGQIGEVVAGVINLLNPDVVSAWGYLVDSGDQFLAGMHETIYKDALPSAARAVTLVRSELGDDAGIRGAALTVIEETLNPEAIDLFVVEVLAES